MNYNRDYFIFGEPIETKFGTVRFLTFKEYNIFLPYLSLFAMNNLHIYYHFKQELKNPNNNEVEFLKSLKLSNLREIVISNPQFLETYVNMFNKVIEFKEGIDCSRIFETNEDFFGMRKLIMDMNGLTEQEVSPNEEIQIALERSRRVKQSNASKQSFIDMVTSIVAGSSHSFEEVANMNVMQVHALYTRIGAFFNYQTSTLFATVAEKVNIELWNRHIDLFETESHAIEYNKFKNTTGSIFSD